MRMGSRRTLARDNIYMLIGLPIRKSLLQAGRSMWTCILQVSGQNGQQLIRPTERPYTNVHQVRVQKLSITCCMMSGTTQRTCVLWSVQHQVHTACAACLSPRPRYYS